FRFGTNQDLYAIFNITFAVDAYVPEIHALHTLLPPSTIPPNGVVPDSEYTFRVQVTNKGNEGVENGKVEIPIPDNVTIDLGSVTKTVGNVSISGNKLIWDIGTISHPTDPNTILAELTYRIKVKSCDNITLNDECTADIYLDGEISGKGINSKQDFDSPFIKEYSTGQTGCTQLNDPIFGGYDLGIDLSSCGFTPTVNATPQ